MLPPGGLQSPAEDEWARTRAMTGLRTHLVGDEDSYLDSRPHTIGRRIDPERVELFVVCDPAEALHQQFEHHAAEFLTLHDLAGADSLRLLHGLARALRQPLQRLVVRRQGFGVALATLPFVELPGPGGGAEVRIYSTQAEMADPAQRNPVAQVLLGYSRLAVVLTGGASAETAGPALAALREALGVRQWRNRHLLWLPVGRDALASPLSGWPLPSTLQVHTAAPVPELGQAWPAISGLWNRLRGGTPVLANAPAPSAAPPAMPRSSGAAAAPASMAPLPLRPMPATGAAAPVAPAPAEASGRWTEYIRACAAIPGMLSCCLFELATERVLASAGARPGAAALASSGAAMCQSMLATARTLGLPGGAPELAVTLDEHHLLLHPLAAAPGLALHAVLDGDVANLTLVRLKLHRLDADLDASPGR